MRENDNLKFKLFSIGKVKLREGHTYVELNSEFKKGLKFLELFSHILIFYKDEYITKLATVEILNLDIKEGLVEINSDNFKEDTLIFDIKPYFPCEDRVKDAVIYEGYFNDIVKYKNSIVPSYNREENNFYFTKNLGMIRKIGDEHYLELSNVDSDFIRYLQGFSHIKIIWWFNKFDKSTYRKITECNPPYENAPRTGVFATRSPVRPNPIAITTAKILEINSNNNRIKISYIDSFDRTPIIDIIPYIPSVAKVDKYYVPSWLKHWPEYLDDSKYNSSFSNIKIIESDIKRINKFISSKEININKRQKVLEENIESNNEVLDYIVIKNARQNNLKNVSVKIPKNKITVITGVSGSGKSSLAFDTIYAESQRRFMENISSSGKALFEQLEKADFDQITGLMPAVKVEQKILSRNPRSTVGTITDIYDYIRLIFSKIGSRHCKDCGRTITTLKVDEIVTILSNLEIGIAFNIRAFNKKEILFNFVVSNEKEDDNFYKKLKIGVTEALSIGNGAIIVNIQEEEFLFQTKEICYHCKNIFFELTPSIFSFNNPESMCPVCKGLGVKLEVDVDRIISKPNLSILDGASDWFGKFRKYRENPNANWMKGEVIALAEAMNVNLELPWNKLPEEFKTQVLYGSNNRKVRLVYKNNNGRMGEIVRPVEGAYNAITRLFIENNGGITAEFMKEIKCKECNGERLTAEARLVTIAGTRFPEIIKMTIEELRNWIMELPLKISEEEFEIASQLIKDIKRKLDALIEVGVAYLTIDRPVVTLSGGEAQRLRLATKLGGSITNILYILDEPFVGLHPKDHENMIKIIKRLRDEGNTVIIVEHNINTMLEADKIIDIGPGAGIYGGNIIAEGTPKEISENKDSVTGKYLKNIESKKIIQERKNNPYGWIKIKRAKQNNLKNIECAIPLGLLTCVTGVSGSGKSTLILKTLYEAVEKHINKSKNVSINYDKIDGLEGVDKIISISQKPIGKTPRSNPATYTGLFDNIRDLFADLNESKAKGYKKNKFSFNSKEGQCEACKGEGRKCIQMHFMPDVWTQCSVCKGQKFKREVLDIKYKEKNIADVLDMNIYEALKFFEDDLKITKILKTLNDVGLGYLKLGQSALTLSGGEAQRIKLAKELCKEDTGNTIYLLDEPTIGLHLADVENLLQILNRIKEKGNTVLVIEHNLEVIRNSDWIIDLGPEGGEKGGYLVFQGTPSEIVKVTDSYTGQCLKKVLY